MAIHGCVSCFFFNDTATTDIYTYLHTLSLHDALPIFDDGVHSEHCEVDRACTVHGGARRCDLFEHERCLENSEPAAPELLGHRHSEPPTVDRKSTRLNSSH